MSSTDDVVRLVQDWLAEPVTLPHAEGLARVREGVRRTPQQRVQFTMRWRRPRMLVPALALVVMGTAALAGSALIPGIAPSPTDRLLGRLETKEVEPGVVRVLADSTGRSYVGVPFADVAAGPEGSVWLARVGGAGLVTEVFRVDVDGREQRSTVIGGEVDLAVGVDGTLFKLAVAGLLDAYDGEEWRTISISAGSLREVEVGPDGSVWAAWSSVGVPGAGRLSDDGTWDTIDASRSTATDEGSSLGFAVTSPTEVWVSVGYYHRRPPGAERWRGLLRAEDGSWHEEHPLAGVTDLGTGPIEAGPMEAGPDGTLWVYLAPNGRPGRYLARHDDQGWTVFGGDDGVPELVSGQMFEADLAVDGSGRVWMADLGTDDIELPPGLAPWDGGCNGVLSFDGMAWRQYLRNVCVRRIAAAPDGGVWAVAEQGTLPAPPDAAGDRQGIQVAEPAGLYLIRPDEPSGG